MRFISCASYYGTGSSAITDFVSEFDNVFDYSDEEFRFIQDPDGISDLEFNLVECFNRHNSGHSLKRYKKLIDFYNGTIFAKKYRSFFGSKWEELSNEYIKELTDFTYKGWWDYDLYDRGIFYYYLKKLPNKILKKTIWKNKPDRSLKILKNEITYCAHPSEEKFLEVTQRYIETLFSSIVPKKYDTIMVDQLVPPINTRRYLRYFKNNIKVVIVDRDPRDIFVLDKYIWKDGVLPSDVKQFVKWFKYTREHRKFENVNDSNILFVRFEDLIYNYDYATSYLIKWLNLNPKFHSKKKTKFIPEISKKNTQTWKSFPECSSEVSYIEQELSEYLYDFQD